jgi:hypothetical protein
MMKPLLFTRSSRLQVSNTLRVLCGRSQKYFRYIGFYTGVGLLEEDSRGTHQEVRV